MDTRNTNVSLDRGDEWRWQSSYCMGDCSGMTARRLSGAFYANIRPHEFAGATLTETICTPCAGQKGHDHDEVYIGIQLTRCGRERFQIDDQYIQVGAGDLFVWSSNKTVKFEVLESIHKVTLIVPWSLMRDKFPDIKYLPVAGILQSGVGITPLLTAQILALSSQVTMLNQTAKDAVSRSILEFLSIALCERQPRASFDAKSTMLARVKNFIVQNLAGDLAPTKVAQAHQISLRYLHMLFASSETTVSKYILQKRLEACHRALASPALQRTQISEIAFRWGFNSICHFCRVFKKRYGVTPSEWRRQALASLKDACHAGIFN